MLLLLYRSNQVNFFSDFVFTKPTIEYFVISVTNENTQQHEASHGLSAIAELLVAVKTEVVCHVVLSVSHSVCTDIVQK